MLLLASILGLCVELRAEITWQGQFFNTRIYNPIYSYATPSLTPTICTNERKTKSPKPRVILPTSKETKIFLNWPQIQFSFHIIQFSQPMWAVVIRNHSKTMRSTVWFPLIPARPSTHNDQGVSKRTTRPHNQRLSQGAQEVEIKSLAPLGLNIPPYPSFQIWTVDHTCWS